MKQRPFKLPFSSEDEVISAICRLPKSHQAIIGRVIWWDFYANKLVCNRSTRFDKWLKEPLGEKEPLEQALSKSLQKMGYDKDTSDKRFAPKHQHTKKK